MVDAATSSNGRTRFDVGVIAQQKRDSGSSPLVVGTVVKPGTNGLVRVGFESRPVPI